MMDVTQMSRSFAAKHRNRFNNEDTCIAVSHSKKDSVETASKVVVDGENLVGSHIYRSNWAVVDCGYDVFLGMPWHTTIHPKVDYDVPSVMNAGSNIPLKDECFRTKIRVTNLGVKTFRILLRKKNHKE